jgi:hypothetical protein
MRRPFPRKRVAPSDGQAPLSLVREGSDELARLGAASLVAEASSPGLRVVEPVAPKRRSKGVQKAREVAPAGRRVFTVEEVAELLDVPADRVSRACPPPFSFFPGAWLDRQSSAWRIPEKGVRKALGGELQRWISVTTFAELFEVSPRTIKRAFLAGKVKGKELFAEVRIPESEYWRLAHIKSVDGPAAPLAPRLSFFSDGRVRG